MSRSPARVVFCLFVVAGLAFAAGYVAAPAKTAPAAPLTEAAGASPAMLLVEQRPPSVLPGGAAPAAQDGDRERNALAALAKSEFVLVAALRDAAVRALPVVAREPDAVTWLAGRVTADVPAGSSLVRIAVTGVSPADAVVLANAVAAACAEQAAERDTRVMAARRAELERTNADLETSLVARRKELRAATDAAGVPAGRDDQKSMLSALYQERGGLRVELAKVRAGADGCLGADGREKMLRDEVAKADELIKSCERETFDDLRARVTHLEAASAAVATEMLRLDIDRRGPKRVHFIQPAALPKK